MTTVLSMECPMPAILDGNSPCQHPLKDAKKGVFIYGNDADGNNSVKSFLKVLCMRNDQ